MSFPGIGHLANGYYQNDISPEFFLSDLSDSRCVFRPKGSISRNIIPMNGCLLDVGNIPRLNLLTEALRPSEAKR